MQACSRRALLLSGALAACASPGDTPAPLTLTTEQDYQLMLQTLGIVAPLRSGRNGLDPGAPNFANYDEALANPYPGPLPDPLRFDNGAPVRSAQDWMRRRREIAEHFDREIYGRVPAHTPSVRWDVTEAKEEMVGAVRTRQRLLRGRVDNSACPSIGVGMEMQIVVPSQTLAPAPIVLNLLWIAPPPFLRNAAPEPAPTWRDRILARGWGYALLVPRSVQADNGAGLTRGVIGLCNRGQPRARDDWGALKAWAWGASRAIDFFETDAAIDASRIAIQGHSRYGKAALVAMAYEPRLKAGFISSSGMGGANLARRNWGEIVENVATSGEYHWMAGNYIRYAGPLTAADMPVDAHQLIALAAPRGVFVSSGAQEGDGWVDARRMFMAAAAAGPVYRLPGARDLGASDFPPIETALRAGSIAYRQHSAGHTPGPNWPYFLDFAAREFEERQ